MPFASPYQCPSCETCTISYIFYNLYVYKLFLFDFCRSLFSVFSIFFFRSPFSVLIFSFSVSYIYCKKQQQVIPLKKITFQTLSQRRKAALCAALSFLILSGAVFLFAGKENRAFRGFCDEFFVSELAGNTLNMHYTIANPSHYGLDSYTPVLPAYSRERLTESKEELDSSLRFLRGLNAAKLSEADSYTYRLLLPYLENEAQGMDLYYYSNPLSPSSGTQSQLPILLAEYTFRSRRDVEDYLALLDQTDTYFEGIAGYLRDQAAEGLFMPDYSVDKVIDQCDTIMDPAMLEAETHFLNTTFKERLDGLVEEGILTEDEKAGYMSENSRLLTTVMLPAYQELGDELLLLKGSGSNGNGLAHYPDGREYYLYLLRSNTGSYRDIREIKTMLFRDFNSNLEALSALLQANPSLVSLPDSSPDAFAFNKPADMLKNLQQMMTRDYPALNEVTQGEMPVCTVKSISKNLEEYCSPAFYLTPPLDDIHENVIYINQKNNPEGVELYTTLAHEGYPGHLYQTVYKQLYSQKTQENPVRSLLNYGGYVEGWAMYVELEAYGYAKDLMKDKMPQAETLYEIYKLDRQIQLGLYSLVDIAVHYEGADYGQVHKMLASVGITTPATTRSIYEYIVEEPTTYLKYYLGYLEILNLKKEAKELWGNAYSEYRFHKFYLENGPADFTNLGRQLRKAAVPS